MDFFDKIMMLPGLNKFQTIYKKNKEVLMYLLFGGLTFLVSIGSYSVFFLIFKLNELIANVISWILAVSFAYFTNRKWVFCSNTNNGFSIVKEVVSFFGGRVVTLIVEELILLIFITIMHFNSIAVKVIAQIIVIILNYVISKKIVFKGNEIGNIEM